MASAGAETGDFGVQFCCFGPGLSFANAANGPIRSVFNLGRDKFSIRLARIRIEAHDQEFDRQRPEIDRSILQQFRRLAATIIHHIRQCPGVLRRQTLAGKSSSTLLADLVVDRLQRDHAQLVPRRR